MNIYQKAIDRFGKDSQINQAIEELNELAVALNHYRRGKAAISRVIEEMADVTVMMNQILELEEQAQDKYIRELRETIKDLEDKLND